MKGLLEVKKELNSPTLNKQVYGRVMIIGQWYRIFEIRRDHGHYYGLGYDGIWWPITDTRVEVTEVR